MSVAKTFSHQEVRNTFCILYAKLEANVQETISSLKPLETLINGCTFFINLVYFSVVLRTMCSVLGIWVTQEGIENRKKSAKVLVANYISTLDHLAVDLVMPNILVRKVLYSTIKAMALETYKVSRKTGLHVHVYQLPQDAILMPNILVKACALILASTRNAMAFETLRIKCHAKQDHISYHRR